MRRIIHRSSHSLVAVIFIFNLTLVTSVKARGDNLYDYKNAKDNLEQIVIEGSGHASPLNNHPEIKVRVFNVGSNKPIDSTFTDGNGFFHLELILTGIVEPSENSGARIMKNPYQDDLVVQMYSDKSKDYRLNVCDLSGRSLLNQTIALTAGNNEITLRDLGGAGIKIITITDGIVKETFQAIQLKAGTLSPKVQINQVNESVTASGLKDGETLKSKGSQAGNYKLEFTADGYSKLETVVLVDSYINVNYIIDMIPLANHNFRIKPKTINGDNITSLTLDFKWADGSVTHHSVQGDGFIHVQRTEYENPTTVAEVTHVNDTATYNIWQIFREENHILSNLNYSQNTVVAGKPGLSQLDLENIPDVLLLYLPPTKVPTPSSLIGIYGAYTRMDRLVVRAMMGQRGGGYTTKFVPRAGAENVYVFQMTFNETTGLPIDQANLDRAKEVLDNVLAIYTLNDGTKLLNYEFYTINSYSDPKFLESKARDNHDNMAYTTFHNNNAYNGLGYTSTYSINGYARIKQSFSQYNTGTSNSVVFAEMYQQFTNNSDPPEGSTAPWVYTTSGPSEFGKTMARLIYFLNQGTPTD
jgi:hypothetical protein